MNSLGNNNKIAFLLILISSIVYAYLLVPNFETLEARSSELDEIKEIFEQSLEIQTLRDTLLQEFNKFPEEQVQKIQNSVPIGEIENIAQFFLDLDFLLSTASVPRDTRINALAVIDNGGDVIKYPISISGEMQYATALKLIDAINQWNKSVNIVKVRMQESTSAAGSSLVELNLNIEVLFSKPLETKAGDISALTKNII